MTIVIIVGIYFLMKKNDTPEYLNNQITDSTTNNVIIENGIQIITLETKGGYSPQKSIAQAGIPTIIKFDTNNTFDCSLAIRIPSKNINKILPQTGETNIDLGTTTPGNLNGSCGMGMYPFEIYFKN